MSNISTLRGEKWYAPVDPELKARYEAVHAAIMAGPVAKVQATIDDQSVWRMEGPKGQRAMTALQVGACVCPPEPGFDFYGDRMPAYWMIEDAVGSTGSVANAEAWEEARETVDEPEAVGSEE